jgi:hypothetical protein
MLLVYSLLVPGLEFAAETIKAVAWPVAVVLAVALLRRELAGAFRRIQSVEFPGGKATFSALGDYEKVIAAAVKGDGSPGDGEDVRQEVVRQEESQFSVLETLAEVAPGQAIVDAWGLLEYHLNAASDRVAPDQPHGWPQVARNLEVWDKWPILYPAVLELRRLRDYTVRSNQPPSASDAARYVSVVQDLVTTVRVAFMAPPNGSAGGGE